MRLLFSLFIFIGGPSPGITVAARATDPAGDTYVNGKQRFPHEAGSCRQHPVHHLDRHGLQLCRCHRIDLARHVWVGGETLDTDFPLVNDLQSSGVPTESDFW
jgi:hypothetical protein